MNSAIDENTPVTSTDGTHALACGEVGLAEPVDCETCGMNYDRASWEYETGSFYVSWSAGCYGGESLETSDCDEAVAFFDRVISAYPDKADDLREMISELRSACA